ncbi:MAG: FAD-dependent oxidoreductase [Opitutaceae bacterium]|jgi:hypothetical protein|nr:FAD-dependent oxidoreductase [Opitutaceae bacterium]
MNPERMNSGLKSIKHAANVCVVGGGMAGLIAAVAAARRDASVLLVHDRPMPGGNASSEVRMWILGARGHHRKETGILEEIQLANARRNPGGIYSVWDSVLHEFAKMTPGLRTLLNCSVNDITMDGGRITAVHAWQLTTQTWHTIEAEFFIDCSGDSILAPLSGADVRHGRESREEFGEPVAPTRADMKTMGNSILLQLEETPVEQPYAAPPWACYFDDASNLPSRVGSGFGDNFWWLEIGGLGNTIEDAEAIHDKLVSAAWGIWDYMKNRGPQAEKLKNWRLRWLGALPGKRENRRYLGPHILTQLDVEAGGIFDDIVAYGGWSMDDHHPAGLYYPGKATLFHPAPSPYGIPLRSLYSRNVGNLFCAGRNISATHVALSSTRVMGTCSILGQAAGTAAALCHEKSCLPAELSTGDVTLLQTRLMEDDCWLPGLTRPVSGLTRQAKFTVTGGGAGDTAVLLDGHERDADNGAHCWSAPVNTALEMRREEPRHVECLRLVFDSDLNNNKIMPCMYPLGKKKVRMPETLVRDFRIEVQTGNGNGGGGSNGDGWETLHRITGNTRRLVVLPVGRAIRALRWTGTATWGAPELRIYSMDTMTEKMPLTPAPVSGKAWTEVVANIASEDLAEPDHGLENA